MCVFCVSKMLPFPSFFKATLTFVYAKMELQSFEVMFCKNATLYTTIFVVVCKQKQKNVVNSASFENQNFISDRLIFFI